MIMNNRSGGAPAADIETVKNAFGYQFPVIPGPYTCETCRSKEKCDDGDFVECNYHEPCYGGCLFHDICNDRKIIDDKHSDNEQFWIDLSERIYNCSKEEQILIGHGYFNWSPASRDYCEKCSMWHPTGKYCTRHCEPCAGRTDE